MAPLALCESNPHYVTFRGRPAVLVTSGEHYGAVLNPDFDFRPYLDALAADGLNLTRTFCGTYWEVPSSFGIVGNTLAPADGRALSPWARSSQDGYAGGGNKFDLARWDETFFARLTEFATEADRRDIVVEVVLFCFPFYNDDVWNVCPMNPACNTTGAALADRRQVLAVEGNPLLEHQERLVRRIVTELNALDNVYFEIMNEPYSAQDGQAFDPWQDHMTDVIVETERTLAKQHLIARNVQNRAMRVADLHPAVGIVNFHYAEPTAVAWNYHLGRAIADDETGFKGQACSPYRQEAWRFMLAGGGIVSHLDYSFTAESPDGTATIKAESPSFGGPELRRQLAVLKRFIESLPFTEMAPHDEVANLFGSRLSGATVQVLAKPGAVYAAYICGGGPHLRLGFALPAGTYSAEWLRPTDGHVVRRQSHTHAGGNLALPSPVYAEDLALVLRAT